MAIGDTIASDNPSVVNPTVDPAVHVVSKNPNSNGGNSTVDTSNVVPPHVLPASSSQSSLYTKVGAEVGIHLDLSVSCVYTPVYYSAQPLMPFSQSYPQLAPSVSFPQQHVSSPGVFGIQSYSPVLSPTLPSPMGSSVSSSPQAHIAMPETVADNTW
ncbi:hypothetical protein V6N11_060352 [Hibiscus sabdariffa]|uniref:Uncharacterized protein n=1 Tax=Hibiscus sabdariffa TaxID=183260 RepID=A0ABR2QQ27_9ROSI